MADDQKLTIGINVTADTRGAQQAQQAVQAVTSGTKQATQATAEAGQRAEGAARAWEGLRMSAQGGLQSIVGLGKAASGALQAVVGAVPFAKWIMWATALVAIVGQLTGTFREWFSSTKEGAESTQKPLQTVKEQLEELDRATTSKLRAQLNGITTAANEAAARIDALRTVSDALNDAQEAVSLARIRANATMSPLEKLDAEQRVRETYRTARQEQAGQAIVDASANSAREQLAYAESIATAAQATADAQKIYDKLAADDEAARAKRLAAARAAQSQAEIDAAAAASGNTSIDRATAEAALAAADADLAAAKKAADKEAVDAWKKEVADAKAAVDARQKSQDEVTAKAAAAAESAKLAAIGLQAKFDALKATASGERKVAQINRADESYKATKEATEKNRATAEDRKKAEEEIRKNRAAREAAAQARGQETGAYYYTDEELAAQKKELEDFNKKFPKQTKAPSKSTPSAPKKPAGYEMVDGVMRPVGAAEDPEMEQGSDGVWRKKGTKPTTLDPNKIRRTPAAPSAQPGAAAPTAQGPADQLPDLATPLKEAAQKAGDSATQSADSIQAAAEAAKQVADNTKPLDASALTAALQSAATAQQTASTQTAAGIQQMVTLAEQQTALAKDQAAKIATMTTQINSLRVEVGQLRAQVRAA